MQTELSFPVLSLAPHLRPRVDPLAYTHPDTWDASTPEELHVASWGIWMREVLARRQGFTLLLTTPATPSVGDLLWMVTPPGTSPVPAHSLFIRRLQGRRIQRGVLHAATCLQEEAVYRLAYQPVPAPVVWSPSGSWDARVIPPMGPSRRVDLRDALAVTEVLGGGYYAEASLRDRPALRVWRAHYGYNPIAEFRRLFEQQPWG